MLSDSRSCWQPVAPLCMQTTASRPFNMSSEQAHRMAGVTAAVPSASSDAHDDTDACMHASASPIPLRVGAKRRRSEPVTVPVSHLRPSPSDGESDVAASPATLAVPTAASSPVHALRRLLLRSSSVLRSWCSGSAVDSDGRPAPRLDDALLQSMLDSCAVHPSTAPADSTAVAPFQPSRPSASLVLPSPLSMVQSYLRHLDSMHIECVDPAQLGRMVAVLARRGRCAARKVALMLGGGDADDERAVDASELIQSQQSIPPALEAVAWVVVAESGASIDAPFFVQLLRLQCGPDAWSSLVRRVSPTCESSAALVSLLQSFVRHYNSETRDPLVALLNDTRRGGFDRLFSASARTQARGPLGHPARPHSQATAAIGQADGSANSTPSHTCSSATPLESSTVVDAELEGLAAEGDSVALPLRVHRLLMRLGPRHFERLHAWTTQMLEGGCGALSATIAAAAAAPSPAAARAAAEWQSHGSESPMSASCPAASSSPAASAAGAGAVAPSPSDRFMQPTDTTAKPTSEEHPTHATRPKAHLRAASTLLLRGRSQDSARAPAFDSWEQFEAAVLMRLHQQQTQLRT